MRLPLVSPVDSRDGSADKDSRSTNVLIEQDDGVNFACVRPAIVANAATATATNGQGLVNFAGDVVAIYSGKYYLPAAGVMGSGTTLTSASTSAQFDFAESTT